MRCNTKIMISRLILFVFIFFFFVAGGCIPIQFKCDGDKDCEDGSDESKESCQNKKCNFKNHFKCSNSSYCIPLRYLCDGDNDCLDGSDEAPDRGCKIKTCKPDQFK